MSSVGSALITGIAIPLAATMLKRHYAQHPKEWEQVFATLLLSAASIAAAVWLNNTTDNASNGPFLVDLIVSIVGGFLFLGGFFGIFISALMAKDIYSKPE
jgi:hypothetical protein